MGPRLASWRTLILTFRAFDLIRQFVRLLGTFVGQVQPSVHLVGKEAQDTCKGGRSSNFVK